MSNTPALMIENADLENVPRLKRIKEVLQVVALAMRPGFTLTRALEAHGLDSATYYRWMAKPDVQDMVGRLKKGIILAAQLEAVMGFPEIVRHQRKIAQGEGLPIENSTAAAKFIWAVLKDTLDQAIGNNESEGGEAKPQIAMFNPTFIGQQVNHPSNLEEEPVTVIEATPAPAPDQ